MGDRLGNSWRIAGDGTNWGALSNCINENSQLQTYARPGAWNDPDLLQGTGIGSNDKATNPMGCFDKALIPQADNWYQTEQQSRAQFSMWAVMSAPLLISADVGQVSAYSLETWSNQEIIAVNQELRPGGPYQGARLVGGNLTFDKTKGGSGMNVWGKLLPEGDFALVFVNNEGQAMDLTCDQKCFTDLIGDTTSDTYTVRDMWAHKDVGSLKAPYSWTAHSIPAHGGVAAFRAAPAYR